jgi:putative intracellular protease/amidase
MVRGHPGLRALVRAVAAQGKPIGAVGRGLKLLLMSGVLDGKSATCAPQMRDDVQYALAPVEYVEAPVVLDQSLLTCQGTEALPQFMSALVFEFGTN